jgi:Holliday junction resolvase RusA-like endonuclease
MSLHFAIEGKPVPWARARTRNGQHFIAPKVRAAMKAIQLVAKSAMRGMQPWPGPVSVEITVWIEPPKSWSKRLRGDAVNGLVLPTSKPDCDNFGKLVLDALNGIAWTDDAQVVDQKVSKRYAGKAVTYVTVKALGHATVGRKAA